MCNNTLIHETEQIGATHLSIDGSVQDCTNSIAKALELLQSCTKPLQFPNYINTSYY